jgi:cytochrome c-type biogenesis protein
VIFILLGLTATALGQTLRDNQDVLEKIAGVLMIVMGAIFVGSMFIARLSREWHVDALLARAGRGGPVVAGAAFAIAWTPCVGPTLGAINALAAVNGNVLQGMGLLAVYSAGLAIPFLLTALAFSRMTTAFAAVKRHYWVITTIGGLILIAMGILILTGEFFQLNIEAQKLTNDLGLNL